MTGGGAAQGGPAAQAAQAAQATQATCTAPLFTRERLIRFSDCDPAGIVFYPQYFVMFNGLVEDWFNDGLGVAYHDLLMRRRVGLPTVHLQADFKAVSRLGDRVQLQLAVARLGRRSLTLQLRCVGAGKGAHADTLATAAPAVTPGDDVRMTVEQVIVTTSLVDHRSLDVPDDVRAAIERLGVVTG